MNMIQIFLARWLNKAKEIWMMYWQLMIFTKMLRKARKLVKMK